MAILLVDDDNDSLEVTARLLRWAGFTVHVARTATQASEIAARSSCRLVVVSDIGLPDRSGLELMRELKEMYGLKGIALTGHAGQQHEEQSVAAGFSKHLEKPVAFRVLLGAINEVLD
jgi:CheY-like chemotaxis protein